MSVCPSVCPFGTKLSESSYFSFRSVLSVSQDLSQVSVSSLTYFVVQTEPKILRLVTILLYASNIFTLTKYVFPG